MRDGYGQTETHRAWSATRRAWRCAPARWAGPCPATAWCCSTPRTSVADEGELAVDAAARAHRPDAGLRRTDPTKTQEALGGALLPHRRRGAARRRRLHTGTSAAPTTCSRPATTASAPSSWKARSSSTRSWPRPRWCPAPTRSSWRCPRPSWCSSPATQPSPRAARVDPRSSCAHASRPTSACAGSSSAELPKTISGKIRRVQLRQAEDERRARGERGALEFWEEDFPELK